MMAKIATCPKCAAQLGLSDAAALNDRLECPECQAEFLLGETIQIALPVARVLGAEEATPAPIEAEPNDLVEPTKLVAETFAPEPTKQSEPELSSWEKRLKNAIATDGAEDATTSSDVPDEPIAREQPAAVSAPSFEFELDLETPSEPTAPTEEAPVDVSPSLELPKRNPLLDSLKRKEPAGEPHVDSPPTLADFAAKAAPQPVGFALPKTKPASVESSVKKPEAAAKPAVKKASKVAATKPNQAVVSTTTSEGSSAVAEMGVAKRRLAKVAAYAAGPIAGCLLGLYGLMWLQGPRGDHVGLAHVLPQSMLPAAFDAEAAAQADDRSTLAAARDLKEQPSKPMRRDNSVQPAAAHQPLTKGRTTLQDFIAAVDSAERAMPALLTGNLSEAESIRRKGQAYMSLCQLAEHFDFATQPGLAPTVHSKIEQAQQIYQQVSSSPSARGELAHIAGRWWEFDQRPNQGIFITGQVEDCEAAGNGAVCQIRINPSVMVPVLINHSRFSVGESVAVIGQVVTNPSVSLPGIAAGAKIVAADYSYTWDNE